MPVQTRSMAKKATVPPPAPVVVAVAPVATAGGGLLAPLASPAADAFRASLRRKERVASRWLFVEDLPLMMRKLLEAADLIVQVHSLLKGDPLREPVEDTLAAADGLEYVRQVLVASAVALAAATRRRLAGKEYDLLRIGTVLYNSTMKEYNVADAKLCDMYLSCE